MIVRPVPCGMPLQIRKPVFLENTGRTSRYQDNPQHDFAMRREMGKHVM